VFNSHSGKKQKIQSLYREKNNLKNIKIYLKIIIMINIIEYTVFLTIIVIIMTIMINKLNNINHIWPFGCVNFLLLKYSLYKR
jgi:hypothetical protein